VLSASSISICIKLLAPWDDLTSSILLLETQVLFSLRALTRLYIRSLWCVISTYSPTIWSK
jgi:hypothetical protein